MKKIRLNFLFILGGLILSGRVQAIDMWHSNLVFANQGQCAATFTFDSGSQAINKLKVQLNVLDKTGKKIQSGVLEVANFGESEASRYGDAILAGEDLCDDDLRIVVTKATATLEGKATDLLKTKQLTVRPFKPYTIRLTK